MKAIGATFWTWNHADGDTATTFYRYLRQHPLFTPEKIGSFEPLKQRFQEVGEEEFARLLLEERMLLTVRAKPPRQRLMQINLVEPRKPNTFSCSVSAQDLGSKLPITEYLTFLTDLFLLFDFDYGCACHTDDWYRKNMEVMPEVKRAVGVDLRQYLPGVYWGNFFGSSYVQQFGRDTIQSAPAYAVQEVAEDRFLVLSAESPFEYDKAAIQQRELEIMQHLGQEAFFEGAA